MRVQLQSEDGLSLTEVLIAVLIIGILGGVATLASVRSTSIQVKVKAAESMEKSAEEAVDHLRSHRAWMDEISDGFHSPDGCTADCPLSVPAGVGHSETADSEFDVKATVTPVDSDADGIGDSDRDGTTPDLFRLTVVVSVTATDAQRLGRPRPVRYVTTLDPRGRTPEGSVVVEVCEVINQVDERMSIEGCAPRAAMESREMAATRMRPCPDGQSCVAYDAVRSGESAGMMPADPMGTSSTAVVVKPVDNDSFGFTLTNGPDAVSSSSAKYLGRGRWLFRDLKAGTYSINSISGIPAGTRIWKTKSSPQYGKVVVEPTRKSHALMVFRPNATGTVVLDFERRIEHYHLSANTKVLNLPQLSCGDVNTVMITMTCTVDNEVHLQYSRGEYVGDEWVAGAAGSGAYFRSEPAPLHREYKWQAGEAGKAETDKPKQMTMKAVDPAAGDADGTSYECPDERALCNGTAKLEIRGIPAGLNRVPWAPNMASNPLAWQRGGVGASGNVSGFGSFLWVDPRNGNVNGVDTPHVTIQGEGECIWTGTYLGGDTPAGKTTPRSGATSSGAGWPCEPCTPYWEVTKQYVPNACTILWRIQYQTTVHFHFELRWPPAIKELLGLTDIVVNQTKVGDWTDIPLGEPKACDAAVSNCREMPDVTITTDDSDYPAQPSLPAAGNPPPPPPRDPTEQVVPVL